MDPDEASNIFYMKALTRLFFNCRYFLVYGEFDPYLSLVAWDLHYRDPFITFVRDLGIPSLKLNTYGITGAILF